MHEIDLKFLLHVHDVVEQFCGGKSPIEIEKGKM